MAEYTENSLPWKSRTMIHQIEQQGPNMPEGMTITTSTNGGDEYTPVSVPEHAPDSITIRGCPPECGESLRTRITELEQERDEARAEVERLRRALIDARLMSGRKMPTSDEEDKTDKAELAPYKSTICELLDEIKAMAHELAVRERQAEILDEEWDGRHTVESALSQARAEIAKEAEVKPEATP